MRAQILAQHAELREVLKAALESSTRALKREDDSREKVAAALRDLRQRIRTHLAFEERWLVPVLADSDAWGAERVRGLLAEHDRQRAVLDSVLEGIDGEWDAERLALALRSLATDLLIDMEEEEAGPLEPDLLREDVVSIDQATD